MASVYALTEQGTSEPMKSVVCTNEDKELQTILKNNLDLLPGDQIQPDAPCRWMLIRREMPVPDPSTGSERWSIDFLLVDQNATPTFVECKRYLDTRARREVVGQVLEYAANAQYFWTADDLHAHAESTAKETSSSLDAAIRKLQPGSGDSAENFFTEVYKKLKASEIRIIFFLEQAPPELKRLAEFMNAQMGNVDVLLVEAKQYEGNGVRIVVPTVWGFTEQIRQTKRDVARRQSDQPIATNWESFRNNAIEKGLDNEQVACLENLYDTCKELNANIAWGRGSVTGSFNPNWSWLHRSMALFSVYANGNIDLHVFAVKDSDRGQRFLEVFSRRASSSGLILPPKYQDTYVTIAAKDWLPRSQDFLSALKEAIQACQAL